MNPEDKKDKKQTKEKINNPFLKDNYSRIDPYIALNIIYYPPKIPDKIIITQF